MAQRITKNSDKEVHVVSDATGFINVNGGAAINAANADGDGTLTGLSLKKVVHSASTGRWTVSRGGNTISVLSGSGEVEYDSMGLSWVSGGDEQANVVFTLNSGQGTIALRLGKIT
jgi:hypothetical protein